MRRRQFLYGTLASVVYVACGKGTSNEPTTSGAPTSPPPLGGPQPPGTSSLAESDRVFPQGVASGDPRNDRVVLWTRVEPGAAGRSPTEDIAIDYLIARDELLTDVVARGTATATAAADHTLRLVPTGLAAGATYFYRFAAAGTTTQVGRTKTAPAPDADVPVTFAFASCQDFIGRYYHAWRALLEEPTDLDFVLFLGDYVYESVNDKRFQSAPTPDRTVLLPNGRDVSREQDGSRRVAATLDDYRVLYKTYRSDALLKEVHRRYPFIAIWDDHEFSDDCWQDHSTYFDDLDPITKLPTLEQDTARRNAADRAFFEFQPVDVVFDANAGFPNDIRIYRQLAWGRHAELFMTDERYYRSDHVVLEGPPNAAVGKPDANTQFGSRYFVRKAGFDPLEASVRPTMLGAPQKAWLIGAITASKATWKVWGNEVQMYEMALDPAKLPLLSSVPSLPSVPSVPSAPSASVPIPDVALLRETVYVDADQWDGYRSERREILAALQQANVDNLLVCTGDIHSFWAAELHPDFAAPSPKPIGVEYVTAGISSSSLLAVLPTQLLAASPLSGVAAAIANGVDKALLDTNPHLRFADADAYGFALVTLDAARAHVTFVEVANPTDPTYGGVVARRQFETLVGTNRIATL